MRETVHRAKQDCEAIFDFAIAVGKCKLNPASRVTKALAPKPPPVHFAAVTELADSKLLMQQWSDYLDELKGGGCGEVIEFQRRE